MNNARVLVNGIIAGVFTKINDNQYRFTYDQYYSGPPVSLTMPVKQKVYDYNKFPPFFEGLLPEGMMLEALLRKVKLDKNDYFGQLIHVGQDVVGAVSIEEII